MPLGLKRTDLQTLAKAKLDDADLLLQHGRYSNAYYLCGYAVELGLKACIARTIVSEVIPDKKFINETYVHKLGDLVGVAGLKSELKKSQDADPNFAVNWALVIQWTPEVRYESIDPYTAQITLTAINDRQSGVFQWINKHW